MYIARLCKFQDYDSWHQHSLGLNSHSLLFSQVMFFLSYFLTSEFLKDYSDVFSQRLIIPWPFQQVSKAAQRHQYLNKERQHAETQQGFLGS